MTDSNRIKIEMLKYAFTNRIPIQATIEITGRCNFKCVHCYVSDTSRSDFLSVEQFKSFIDQFMELGGLYITITGGDPFLHPDFKEIYLYLVSKRLVVRIFTNASNIDDAILKLFETYPPAAIEVTLYGFSSETYFLTTGTELFYRVIDTIEKLVKAKQKILLKMFVLKENVCDFQKIIDFADQNGLSFKSSAMILDDTKSSAYKHQVDLKEIFQLEVGKIQAQPDYDNAEEFEQFVRNQTRDMLLQCTAGRSSCWVSSKFRLKLCNFFTSEEIDLNRNSFRDAWDMLRKYTQIKLPQSSPCYSCKYLSRCTMCAAKSYTLHGNILRLDTDDIICNYTKIGAERSLI